MDATKCSLKMDCPSFLVLRPMCVALGTQVPRSVCMHAGFCQPRASDSDGEVGSLEHGRAGWLRGLSVHSVDTDKQASRQARPAGNLLCWTASFLCLGLLPKVHPLCLSLQPSYRKGRGQHGTLGAL